MLVPNNEIAEAPLRKITDYLLNPLHPEGADKAHFFLAHGFSPHRPQELISALLRHVRTCDIVNARTTRFGIGYAVEGPFAAPGTSRPSVRSVWFVDLGATVPRLVTAYPAKK